MESTSRQRSVTDGAAFQLPDERTHRAVQGAVAAIVAAIVTAIVTANVRASSCDSLNVSKFSETSGTGVEPQNHRSIAKAIRNSVASRRDASRLATSSNIEIS